MSCFLAIDLETTGFRAEEEGITEVGCALFREGVLVGQLALLVNPRCALPPEVQRLTGITPQMVAQGVTAQEAIARAWNLWRQLNLQPEFMVAHNVKFEAAFLSAALPFPVPASAIRCTKARFGALFPDHTSSAATSLEVACARLRVPLGNHHRALNDAVTCGRLWLAMDAYEAKMQEIA
jgi:DNA polymerase-3 subunit epsilon